LEYIEYMRNNVENIVHNFEEIFSGIVQYICFSSFLIFNIILLVKIVVLFLLKYVQNNTNL
jgi:hypothetical protein